MKLVNAITSSRLPRARARYAAAAITINPMTAATANNSRATTTPDTLASQLMKPPFAQYSSDAWATYVTGNSHTHAPTSAGVASSHTARVRIPAASGMARRVLEGEDPVLQQAEARDPLQQDRRRHHA